jgi:hypothetical protein
VLLASSCSSSFTITTLILNQLDTDEEPLAACGDGVTFTVGSSIGGATDWS